MENRIMVLSKIKNKSMSLFWKVLNNIPNFKKRIFSFYAWRIFEFVPQFKKLIYKIYDKFWYLELFIENNNLDLKKSQINKYNIKLDRLKYYLSNKQVTVSYLEKHEDDWDNVENLRIITESNEFILVKNHFSTKIEWREIPVYQEFIKLLSTNQQIQNCSNENEFLKMLDSLDRNFQNYATDNSVKFRVGIDRNGKFIIFDNLFLLALIKHLNVDSIPIEVIVRHPLWLNFRSEFLKFHSIHGELYQPLIHPDLIFKSSYTDERFLIIKENLTTKKGTLLDIGANLAYFCHKFEEMGFDCYAVEIRPSNVHYMKKLRTIESKKFKIINKSIFDLKEKLDYNIVLALNIFHHFLREKELYHKLIEFLGRLEIDTMYFQPHDPSEKIMQNAYINYNNEQFVKFIVKNSCLNKFELITKQSDGRTRPIYRIFK